MEKSKGKKEVPAIYTEDPNNPRLKSYQDSLGLYNNYNRNNARFLSRGAKPDKVKTNVLPGKYVNVLREVGPNKFETKKELNVNYHPTIKPTGLQSYTAFSDPSNRTNALVNGKKINNLNEVPSENFIFKEPVQPVFLKKPPIKPTFNTIRAYKTEIIQKIKKVQANKKPIPKKQEVIKKEEAVKNTEQPIPVEKKQNTYEGTPVYSPGSGSGLPSALVGFRGKSGDTTYIQPEDYERFAVPKYAKDFIKSKSNKK
jgi:hypothetical protein